MLKKGKGRVMRGGGWFDDASGCRSAYRMRGESSDRYFFAGFRLAQVDQPTAAKRQQFEAGEEAKQARWSRKRRGAIDGMFGRVKKYIQGSDS